MSRYTVTVRDNHDQLDVAVFDTDEFTVEQNFTPDTHERLATHIVIPHRAVSPEPSDDEIMTFMLGHLDMSPSQSAAHFGVSLARVRGILARDLRDVLRGGS